MYAPKPKYPFVKKSDEAAAQWDEHYINNLLQHRRMLNGFETDAIMQLKPLDTQLDVLYLTAAQIPDGLYVKIADEFGTHISPELNKHVRAENVWTPKSAIKFAWIQMDLIQHYGIMDCIS